MSETSLRKIKRVLAPLVIFLVSCASKYECPENAYRYSDKVCGVGGQIYCVLAPCPKYIQTTFDNSKAACEQSEYYTHGECDIEGAIYSVFDKWNFDAEDGT